MKIALSPVTAVCCDAQFQVVEDAAIHIENGHISYVGKADSAPAFRADETLGGAHFVAMPGLINTHTHAAMTLCRGFADDMALEPWLSQKIWPFERNLSEEHVYTGTLLAIAEMISGGTTTFCDMYFFERQGVRAALETGMRMCPGAVLLGFLPGADQKILNAREFIREFSAAGDGRITPFMAPHSLYTCDASQWQKIIAVARETGARITTHAAETRREVEDVTRDWGQSPIQTLEKIGALEAPLLAAHCVCTNERDREIMQNASFFVAHNPQSNLKLASGIAPISDYLQRGITVGLGPDGTASNNNLDMWEEMRLAATLHKAATLDPTAIPARQALEMATIQGAKCLGLESEIGSLEVGKKADICVLDFDKSHLTPCHNVISNLVYAAGAADVHSVLIDGKWMLKNRALQTLDGKEVRARSRQIARDLAAQA
ncbi:5-methylthioadenosine/S-adenosylhomocysteine deaminase [Abditibacterium utsteinense]|uniref:5-methylthioadenosine/S-adenosylhomocysteine deaminase n=1 Tax=Abditibacterium utsteinense TaxID=1960156 RepID=A0A2S8SVT1_9BACT|nr:amidohydrolase [Abditibacterium utsteinense]PQV64900.1 5-methylthioadenosine/S-adenosylhomocysteine deaminase [Abditibacterium utsteinense]